MYHSAKRPRLRLILIWLVSGSMDLSLENFTVRANDSVLRFELEENISPPSIGAGPAVWPSQIVPRVKSVFPKW